MSREYSISLLNSIAFNSTNPDNRGNEMKKLSTGVDSTLGNYRGMSLIVFGEDSAATKYLDEKIAESPNGENEEVIADESQMVYLLVSLHFDN